MNRSICRHCRAARLGDRARAIARQRLAAAEERNWASFEETDLLIRGLLRATFTCANGARHPLLVVARVGGEGPER